MPFGYALFLLFAEHRDHGTLVEVLDGTLVSLSATPWAGIMLVAYRLYHRPQHFMLDNPYRFDLRPLKSGVLNISPVYGAFLVENAEYCLNMHKHPTPVSLALTGDLPKSGTLDWSGVRLPDGTCTDLQEATEYGACGIALLVALRLTGMTFVERSAKGTGIDYWLGNERSTDGVFQSAARLEVSRILNGDDAKIAARVNAKLQQTQPRDQSGLPAYVAVVEFRRPETRFVRKVKR